MNDAYQKINVGVKIPDLLVGLLIYISTLFFASNAVLVLVLLVLALQGKNTIWKSDFIFLAIFVLLAFFNIVIHINEFDASRHISSLAVPLVFFMALLAPKINDSALKLFVVLTCFEVLVGIYEFQLGQVAIFASQVDSANQQMSYDSDYLYDLRVYGLSANSSILAEKIFLSILLVFYFKNSLRYFFVICCILGLGLFVTFNRTTIIVTIFFLCLVYLSGRVSARKIFFASLFLIFVSLIISANWDFLLLQFARGSVGELSHSELSRIYFWEKSFDHLISSPLFGNGSLTYRVFSPEVGNFQHAHNSLIMIFSTHGLFIPLFLLAYIFKRSLSSDLRILLAFFAYSITQYFVFWNLSVPDLLFFWFLGLGIYKHKNFFNNSNLSMQRALSLK